MRDTDSGAEGSAPEFSAIASDGKAFMDCNRKCHNPVRREVDQRRRGVFRDGEKDKMSLTAAAGEGIIIA